MSWYKKLRTIILIQRDLKYPVDVTSFAIRFFNHIEIILHIQDIAIHLSDNYFMRRVREPSASFDKSELQSVRITKRDGIVQAYSRGRGHQQGIFVPPLCGEPSSRKSTCCYAKQHRARDIKLPIKRSISASLLPASLWTVFIITSGERGTTGDGGRGEGGKEEYQW